MTCAMWVRVRCIEVSASSISVVGESVSRERNLYQGKGSLNRSGETASASFTCRYPM